MQEIHLPQLDATRFESVLDPAAFDAFTKHLTDARSNLDGRTLWHVNSTATGGGVAEMLQSALCYLLGGGINTRWVVIDGDNEFFGITKRIHHLLHGSSGDGGPLGERERKSYLATLDRETTPLGNEIRPNDVVVLHDPQTLGFAPLLRQLGAGVIWSCHVGTDDPNDDSARAWRFLAPFASEAQRVVFSRGNYAWDLLDPDVIEVIPPCIDVFSPKNQVLGTEAVNGILARSGIVPAEVHDARYLRQDGSPAEVHSRAQLLEVDHLPEDATLVTQISRWDPLKDHLGVMTSFVEFVPADYGAHLVLAGPSPESITDDPEGTETLAQLRRAWHELREDLRRRVHIACLPMDDSEENAAIVNALQRRSDILVQKSIAEGFGLTVAEAMWKRRPTVASAVGGINDQIDDGVNGLLVSDPHDLVGFGDAITGLLRDRDAAIGLGGQAHESVRSRYLAPHYLARFLDLATAIG